ncbi:MAG TPA: PPC domain-containing DNA-binding protein [Thermoanaerobaculia bacterium]|nr:PPC domain-containing DNA-binding protein [Thermoanaerobaculia bacterium]
MQTYNVAPRSHFLLVFDKGDDLLATLRAFAGAHGIRGASFTALGAFRSATIAYWNPATKEYEHIAVDEQVEVLSLVGNLGAEKIHAHVTLGRRDGSAIGGHVIAATVFPTLEMQVVAYEESIVRGTDEETGLSLIKNVGG